MASERLVCSSLKKEEGGAKCVPNLGVRELGIV
jgi:hypothetical protein